MGKHTPGPWACSDGRYGTPKIVHLPERDNRQIATVNLPYWKIRTVEEGMPECEANARLIAAAPDLLAVCQGFIDRLDRANAGEYAGDHESYYRGNVEGFAAMRAAVAKAIGQEP